LGLPCLLPLLECLHNLIKLTYSRNVLICDYVDVIQISQANLHSMYINIDTTYKPKLFFYFSDVDNIFNRIYFVWVTNLNSREETLFFYING
jgi:hypothetical protein